MSVVLSCVQPSYLAWIPLFKRILSGDVFVYLDDVEYSKNSFHNRNYVKGAQGSILLTVPISYKGHSSSYINKIPINNNIKWAKKHWRTIEMNYHKAPYFKALASMIYNPIYETKWEFLGDLNVAFITIIKEYLGINCIMYRSSELGIKSEGNQKLVDICKLLGADSFLVKPNTESYHPKAFFEKQVIELAYFDPKSNPYPQQYDDFISNLSVLDYVMNCGAGKLIW